MPNGIIKSYSSQKGYGFIEGENGNSIFFHVSKVASNSIEKIKIGSIVSFDEYPTPKGMAAENVKVEDTASELYLDPDTQGVIVSKSESCGRENRVVHKMQRITAENRDPDAAIECLKREARQAGCNAIVNLQRDRRTGAAWGSNYRYTIHVTSAEPALVKRLTHTTNLAKASESKDALAREIEQISSATIEDSTVADASGFNAVMTVIGIILVVIVFISLRM